MLRKLVLLGVVLLVCAIVLGITNPDKEAHLAAVAQHMSEEMAEDVPVAGGLIGKVAGELAGGSLNYHNYIVCSTTTRHSELVSIGVLGNVMVFE
jgi:hypothetical protein